MMPEDVDEVRKLGFDGFIKKPSDDKVQFINTLR